MQIVVHCQVCIFVAGVKLLFHPSPSQSDVERWSSEFVKWLKVSTVSTLTNREKVTQRSFFLLLSRVLAAALASVSALYPSDTSPNCFSPVHRVLFHQHQPPPPRSIDSPSETQP